MSELVIRPARRHELQRVGEITVAAYRADGFIDPGANYERLLADAARRAEHAELLVAVDADGVVLGTVTIALPGTEFAEVCMDGELEFRMLATDPVARGRGVGEALTRAVLDRARERGCARVVMCSAEAMTTAHRLYHRIGFHRIPERDWEPLPDFRLRAFAVEL
ncbi:MAG: GNAT family N-acetyltransferase [Pseudonocardiaceae bacterium]|nr:GNAT family N-acetyltransferase [Pseudonocardiaceae bacterium]